MEFSTNQGAENSFYEGFEEHEISLPHLYLKQVTDVSEFEYECRHHVCVGCMYAACVCVCMYLQNNLKNCTVLRSDHCTQIEEFGDRAEALLLSS
jgi:hypothetical protein